MNFDMNVYSKMYHDTFKLPVEERNTHLLVVKRYLNDCDMHVPPAKFPHIIGDISTHKFVSSADFPNLPVLKTWGKDKNGEHKEFSTGTCLNPNYKYGHDNNPCGIYSY